MQSFKPSAPPVLKRILGNPLLYIFLALLLVITGILYIRQQQSDFANQSALQVPSPAGGPTVANRHNFESVQPQNSQIPQTPASSAQALAPHSGAAPTLTAVTAVDSHRENEIFNVRVYYAEVDRATMDLLRQESLATGQYTEFGDFKAGALLANRKASRERGVRILYRTERKFDSRHSNLPQQWFVGTKTPSDLEFGVTTLMTLERGEGTNLRGEIEVQRSFKESIEPNEPPTKRSYPSTNFELTSGMGWMVTITLPTIAQITQDEGDGILRIFQSPQYKSRQTEFTLFFEFDTPAINPNAGKNSL